MKLVVSPTSFATAFAVSALLRAHSKSAVASAVDAAYKSKPEQVGGKHIKKSPSRDQECHFASSGLRGNEADTGILGCTEHYICVEDEHSLLGGKCITTGMKRSLQIASPITCATKCEGTDACKGMTQDFIDKNIGEGSCCGERACYNVNSKWIFFCFF